MRPWFSWNWHSALGIGFSRAVCSVLSCITVWPLIAPTALSVLMISQSSLDELGPEMRWPTERTWEPWLPSVRITTSDWVSERLRRWWWTKGGHKEHTPPSSSKVSQCRGSSVSNTLGTHQWGPEMDHRQMLWWTSTSTPVRETWLGPSWPGIRAALSRTKRPSRQWLQSTNHTGPLHSEEGQ